MFILISIAVESSSPQVTIFWSAGYDGLTNKNTATVAEILRQTGYNTLQLGESLRHVLTAGVRLRDR